MDYNVLSVESHTFKVEHHMRQVAEGRYGLPEFQRTFVWDNDRVMGLWDSLYQGFPVGQIMLWSPDSVDFPMRSFGREQKEVLGSNRISVIDGQQRLSAIYLVLSGAIPLRFDLETQRFTFNTGPNDLRLDILRDAAQAPVEFNKAAGKQYFYVHASSAQRDNYGEQINWLNNVLTQREMPSQKIVGSAYSTVLDVFKRLNRQGAPLNEAQLTMAGVSQRWPGVFRKTYDLLRRLNTEMGFDQADDPTFVFQVWTAVHTQQHLVKHLAPEPNLRSKYTKLATASAYEVSWQQSVKGLERLIDVMRTHLDLTNFQFVKAYYPLAVAAHYFATHPAPSKVDHEALVRWLLLGLVSGRYNQRAQSKYSTDIRNTVEGAPLKQLFMGGREPLNPDHVSTAVLELNALLDSNFRSSAVTLLYILARRLGAVDWFDRGVKIGNPLPNGAAWQFHHIFPRDTFDGERSALNSSYEDALETGDDDAIAVVKRSQEELEARIDSLGNLAFLLPATNQSISNRNPSDYLSDLVKTPGGTAVLEAQCIPLDPKLWKHSAFEEFRHARCELIANKARELFFTPGVP